MFSKSVLTLTALAVAQVTLAQPACLLAAVNKFQHPADQKTLCCQEASKVKDYLQQLCASGDTSSAVDAFNSACKDSGYGTCSSSSSSASSASNTGSGSASSTAAPYPVVVTSTSTYFDTVCSCTKTQTKVYSSSVVAGSTGFATATAVGTAAGTAIGTAVGTATSSIGATGSPITPVAPSKTGSSAGSSSSGFTGAASKNVGSVAVGLLAVAGIAVAL